MEKSVHAHVLRTTLSIVLRRMAPYGCEQYTFLLFLTLLLGILWNICWPYASPEKDGKSDEWSEEKMVPAHIANGVSKRWSRSVANVFGTERVIVLHPCKAMRRRLRGERYLHKSINFKWILTFEWIRINYNRMAKGQIAVVHLFFINFSLTIFFPPRHLFVLGLREH